MQIQNKTAAGFLVGIFSALCIAAIVRAHDVLQQPLIADHRYYLEFAEKAFVPGAAFSQDAIIPGGTSILTTGDDGAHGLHYGIHFEPLKYITAVLYAVTTSTTALHIFYIVLFFSPLLYVAYRFGRGEGNIPLLVAVLIYAFAPAAVPVAVESLRPFIVLFPALFLFFDSLIERRPFNEQVFSLNLLAGAREEGIFFVCMGLMYLGLRDWPFSNYARNFAFLLINLGLWVGAYAAYVWWSLQVFEWRSFESIRMIFLLISQYFPFVLGLVFLGFIGGFYFLQRFWLHRATVIAPLALATGLLAVMVFLPLVGVVNSVFSMDALFGRFGMFFFLVVAILVLVWWSKKVIPTAQLES